MTKSILSELHLSINSSLVTSDAPNYRPQNWPPERGWPVVIDTNGQVISRWGDAIWRLDPWAKKRVTLNFGDGPVQKHAAVISPENANLLRIVVGWWIYGSNGNSGYRGLKTRFDQIRQLFVLCTQEGILASELSQFPHVLDQLPKLLQASRFSETLALMHELYEKRDVLGFVILDCAGLACLAAAMPNHQRHQTPYIPPRIWSYQISRLRECLDDFLAHRNQVEDCFRFCLAAYRYNFNNLQEQNRPKSFYPFQWLPSKSGKKSTNKKYYGPFIETARRFGIVDLFYRWLGVKEDEIRIHTLTNYLNLVSKSGLSYLLNFSFMRVEEAWNLRSDCLHIEQDPQFGNIYIIQGRTTKTMSDSKALWVTSSTAQLAVKAMQAVADLRAECDSSSKTTMQNNLTSRYLINYCIEPWGTKFTKIDHVNRPSIPSYANLVKWFDKLFDPEQLRITQEDFELARLVTPTLTEEFTVGKIWPLAWHQLRRTGAVNMQASGLISDASLQFQLKHVTRAMSLYYGQNHSRVRLEEKAHTHYVRIMYETLGKQLQQIASDRFVSPHGEKRKSEIVRLISASDTEKMINLAKKGIISYRPVLLGICANRNPCPYGGIDNIAHCGGTDFSGTNKPCSDVLYDFEQFSQVQILESILDERINTTDIGSPLRASLEAQKRSVENYYNVIKKE